jgi:Family of unknown function (DUF6644)
LQSVMEWLQAWPLAVLIHEKAWLFTVIQVVHVIAISFVIGSIAIMDLRLLGLRSIKRPVTELAKEVLPWTWAAFVLAAAAGSLMFISQATAYFMNSTFWIKMFIMLIAGINMLIFEFITVRDVQSWNLNPTPPLAARLAGGISITCWLLVFVFGRWTGFTVMPT